MIIQLVIAALFQNLAFADLKKEIEFDLIHTVPVCEHDGKKDTWCDKDDRADAAEAAGMEEMASDLLDEALLTDQGRVMIGYLSFSNSTVFNKLCDLGKANVPIQGYFDSDAKVDPTTFPNKLKNNCQGNSGKNVQIHFLGRKEKNPDGSLKEWRLHHNKFLIVDSGVPNADLSINFSSGNLSSFGLSLHFDHWVMTRAPQDSSFAKTHLCVVDSLNKSVATGIEGVDADVDNAVTYKASLKSCLARAKTYQERGTKWIETALDEEKVAPLFSPNDDDGVAIALIDHIDRVVKGGTIRGAIQHFLHQGIAKAMGRAVKRGVAVELVMDDDVVTGGTEVPGVLEFYKKFLKKSATGIRVRFMQTNSVARQMMHNKFLILDGVDSINETRIFSGAGQFTTSAMRNNYENFYITRDENLTARYLYLFDYLWQRTINEKSAASGFVQGSHVNNDLND